MAHFVLQPPKYNFALDPVNFIAESDKMSGIPGDYIPDENNLFCLVKFNKYTDGTNKRLIAVKSMPYSRKNKQANFDIHSLLNLNPTLPNLNSSLSDPDATKRGQATDSFMAFDVIIADSYGIPSVSSDESISSKKYAIYGSSRTIIDTLPLVGFDVHSYVNYRGEAFAKSVTKSQPDWIYFVLLTTGTETVKVEVEINYTDGTSDTYTAANYTFENNPMLNWVATGYMQLEIDSNADSSKIVSGYKVSLKTENIPFYSLKYVLDSEMDWETYLIVDNGLGGIESVKMSGKFEVSVSGSRKILSKKWDMQNYAAGSLQQYNAKGVEKITLNSGWTTNEDYIYHIRQLLVGHLWIIDPVLGFVRVIIENTDIKNVRKADEVLFFLECEIKFAFEEKSMNNFYKKWKVT